jgi:uncharacterized membrane protein
VNQRGELWALWSLAVMVIIGALVASGNAPGWASKVLGTADEAKGSDILVGGLMAALPMLINAIRNLGQSRAMQAMVDQLGQSAPIAKVDE